MAQKYLTMSRHGVYYFQYWIPRHLKNDTFNNKVFRSSLKTPVKHEAIKQSHRLIIVLLDLEEKYSNRPNNFGTALTEMKDDLNKQIENDGWQIEYSHGLDSWGSKDIGMLRYINHLGLISITLPPHPPTFTSCKSGGVYK